MTSPRPVCVILAGPNGAGKSTFFSETSPPGLFVNADNIARSISPENPEQASFEAGRRAIRLLKQLIDGQDSFTYETTLSSHQALNVMRDARSAGYRVVLVFIVLRSAELHVRRVETRVALGGHNIPKEVIRRRYELSLHNLRIAISLADDVAIYDNSSADGPRLLVTIEKQEIVVNRLKLQKRFDRRIYDTIASAVAPATSD